MMVRPSFQFYPADWRNNAKLSRCSRSARGSWMDILCVLHDEDEYGIARYPLAELASAAHVPIKDARELAEKGVLKGADADAEPYIWSPYHAGKHGEPVTLVDATGGPVWFSSRLVRDEWIRKRRGANSRFSAENPSPQWSPTQSPKGGIGAWQGDGPSSSSSSSKEVASRDDAQTTSNQLARLSKILCLPENDFNKQASNLITLSTLKAEGCDFNTDILPAAQRAAKGNSSVQSLRYIVASARESRDGRKALAALPAPFEPASEAGWRDRLRVWTTRDGWLPKWGPDPNQADCKCPADILAELTVKQAAPEVIAATAKISAVHQ